MDNLARMFSAYAREVALKIQAKIKSCLKPLRQSLRLPKDEQIILEKIREVIESGIREIQRLKPIINT